MRRGTILVLAVACAACCATAIAQQPAIAPATDTGHYDVSRECNLVGTVITFDANSKLAPHGARVTLQASMGTVEVHLADSRFLAANHFTIQSGDTLRIIGEALSIPGGQIFAARVIQKGTQALALRTSRGLPVPYVAPHAASPAAATKGAV